MQMRIFNSAGQCLGIELMIADGMFVIHDSGLMFTKPMTQEECAQWLAVSGCYIAAYGSLQG